MKTGPIPHTNLSASELCLGTAEFGSSLDDSVSEEILKTKALFDSPENRETLQTNQNDPSGERAQHWGNRTRLFAEATVPGISDHWAKEKRRSDGIVRSDQSDVECGESRIFDWARVGSQQSAVSSD